MTKKITRSIATAVLSGFLFLTSCEDPYQDDINIGGGKSSFVLHIGNGTTYHGKRTDDQALKAITVPCLDNNTFRLYYSDSVLQVGLPDSFHIVSAGRAGRLRYKECYLEVTSSATDTYLSTGYDHMTVAARGNRIIIDNVWLLHFTSAPQADSAAVSAVLELE